MTPFNRPSYTGTEDEYVLDALRSNKLSGDGAYARQCQDWFQARLGALGHGEKGGKGSKGSSLETRLTPSCTHALEMAALLVGLEPGDEVIMPSYTFVSTANAFALRGAQIVFVDIRPDTMNMDECLIEDAITARTKAVVPVHYAGVACEMDVITEIAQRHGLAVIEDAAQAVMSTYKGKPLGTLGHLAAYSFHETKNFTSGGEGGLLIINDAQFIDRADMIREKGTNRSQFFRGMVDKYTWVDLGSSYLPSELQSAYLWGQLQRADDITANRRATWTAYFEALRALGDTGRIELPSVAPHCEHNGHMFYIKCADLNERTRLIAHLKSQDVMAVFHYVPLHTSPAGRQFGRFHGEDRFTTRDSERLIRLPFWYGMQADLRDRIVAAVYDFYR